MIINTTYGEGGYDSSKPNNNVVETIERINSQECVITEYDGENIVSQETIDMPGVAVNDTAQFTIPGSAIDELVEALDDPSVNSVSELKSAVMEFVQQIKNSN